MNKEYFQERLNALQHSMATQEKIVSQSQANLNAYSGAIQECQFHLNKLVSMEQEDSKAKKELEKLKSPKKLGRPKKVKS